MGKVRSRSGDPQADGAGLHLIREGKQVRPELGRVAVADVPVGGDGLPVRLGSILRMTVGGALERVDFDIGDARPDGRESVERNRLPPTDGDPFRMVRGDDRRIGRCLSLFLGFPRAPPVMVPVDHPSGMLALDAGGGGGVPCLIHEAGWTHHHSGQGAPVFRVGRFRVVSETQRPGAGARRKDPQGKVSFLRTGGDGRAFLVTLGRQPLRIIRRVAGVGRTRFQHADRAAILGQDAADGERLLETDPQVPWPRIPGVPEVKGGVPRIRGGGAEDRQRTLVLLSG